MRDEEFLNELNKLRHVLKEDCYMEYIQCRCSRQLYLSSGIQRVLKFRGISYTKYYKVSAATDIIITERIRTEKLFNAFGTSSNLFSQNPCSYRAVNTVRVTYTRKRDSFNVVYRIFAVYSEIH